MPVPGLVTCLLLRSIFPGSGNQALGMMGKSPSRVRHLCHPARIGFSLTGCAHPRLGLLARLHPRCVELTFTDGTSMRPQEVALPPLRPAYPVHKRGQFQCHAFRIPAIARAMHGSLLAVYDMRYLSEKDLQGHLDIGLSRSSQADPIFQKIPLAEMLKE
jgi:hypothetical protein